MKNKTNISYLCMYEKTAILTLCTILALCGCTHEEDKASATASDFLTAFFDMNFERAAALCNDDIATIIRDTIADSDYPSEEIRAKVIEASKNTTFKIVSSQIEEESGAAMIDYEIHPYGAVGNGSIPRSMRLERVSGEWRVVSLE